MSTTATSFIQSRFLQLGVCLAVALAALAAVGRFVAVPNDQARCESMLNHGWWLDDNYLRWQPAGCMMHTYKPAEISQCLSHSHILYVGDSVVRQQFFSLAQVIQKDIDMTGPKHTDRRFEFQENQLTLDFWWDPYINSSRTIDMLKATNLTEKPSLLVIGSGPWHMRYLDEDYLDIWKDGIDRVYDAVQRSSSVADAVLLAPVEVPEFDLLSPDRMRTITMDKVQKMNDYLREKDSSSRPITPFAVPYVWNDVTTGATNVSVDGIHFTSSITTTQTQLGLNFRCNDEASKAFPMASTCCFVYPSPRWYQNSFFILFLFLVPVGLYISDLANPPAFVRHLVPSQNVLNALFIFGLSVIYMYFDDRTQIFGKSHKFFHPVTFGALMLATLLIGVATMQSKKEGDQGFLNRDQTDEWKGWMQVIILVYHYVGASGTAGVYNAVRILVAAYLFQTGYGHFFFFYKKGDYSLGRILNVMVRLNLLTFVLQYLMNTDYLSYYFTPLVSFWFFVIWFTMYLGHKYNTIVWVILAKIAIASILTTAIIHCPGVLESLFDILKYLFNVHWNAGEWRFRLALDAWIVYFGMLSAYAYIKVADFKLQNHALWPRVKLASLVMSALAMVWYFWFELTRADKFAYNAVHPYISWIPILAFVALRNASVRLRNTTSRFFIFIGRISLETFIGQFHMWLAGDTKGILILLAQPTWARGTGWWLNVILSSVIFIFVSYHLGQSTNELTRWICSGAASSKPKQANYQAVPLLPTASSPRADRETEDSHESKEHRPADLEDDQQPEEAAFLHTDLHKEKPAWKRLAQLFFTDIRVKCALFMLAVAILNHWC